MSNNKHDGENEGFSSMSGSTYSVGDNTHTQSTLGASIGTNGVSDTLHSVGGPTIALTLGVSDVTHTTSGLAQQSIAIQSDFVHLTGGPRIPPGFLGAVGAQVSSNLLDVSVNEISTAYGLLPLTGVTGFYVYVNGVQRAITNAERLDQAAGQTTNHYTQSTVQLTLSYPVLPGDFVQVIYVESLGNVTDNPLGNGSGSLNPLANVPLMPVVNLQSYVNGSRFDPIAFATQVDSGAALPSCGLFERRIGYPAAVVTVDVTPPSGNIIINDDPSSGGIQVHAFSAYDSHSTLITGTDVLYDFQDVPIMVGENFGGVANPSNFENVGVGPAKSIVKSFPLTGGVYPTVTTIVMCVTSSIPASYKIEAKEHPADAWSPIVDSFANPDTLFFPEWTFATPLALAAIRLSYRGDFFTVSDAGTITVEASDNISGTAYMQVSLYPDMRDAGDFPGANAQGWVPFTDGISILPINLINTDRIWSQLRGQATSGLPFVSTLGSTPVLATSTGVFQYSNALLAKTYAVPGSATIQAFTVFQGQIILGMSDGSIWASSSGSNFSKINSATPMAGINCLVGYQGYLYAGTAPNASGNGLIWAYNGTTWSQAKSFFQSAPSCALVQGSYLYVGLTGASGAKQGYVYAFNGQQWAVTQNSGQDAVNALGAGGGFLWAGLSGGILNTGTLNSDGSIASWTIPPQTNDASVFYAIVPSSDGSYIWFCTDTGLTAYIIGTTSYLSVPPPRNYAQGLTAHYQSASSTANAKALVGNSVTNLTFVDAGLDYSTILAHVAAETSNTALSSATAWFAQYSGYVRPNYTETYTFYLTSSTPIELYVGGVLIASSWDTPPTSTIQGTISLIAGQWTSISLNVYGSGEQSMDVEWSSTTLQRETIPGYATTADKTVYTSATVLNASTINSGYAFTLSDGTIQVLDASTLINTTLSVYVRFQDALGNMTPLTAIPYDFVVEQTPTQNGITGNPLDVVGKIYQVDIESKDLLDTFVATAQGPLMSPGREVAATGIYESLPYYVETLTRWDAISFLALIPAAPSNPPGGLQSGCSVELYVKTASNLTDLAIASYGTPYTLSSIPPSNDSGSSVTGTLDISAYAGQYLQFQVNLVSASRNLTPVLNSVTVSYKAAAGSYYFSQGFDISNYSNVIPTPTYSRMLFTANDMDNGGVIQYAYSLSTDPNAQFNFGQYTILKPNTVTELPSGYSQIRFGILLVSVSGSYPAVVDDWAVQFDVGSTDVNFMASD